MTLDERIETLVQSVELMSHMDQTVTDHDAALPKLERLMEPIMTALPGFMALVVDHESRIKKLEGEQ